MPSDRSIRTLLVLGLCPTCHSSQVISHCLLWRFFSTYIVFLFSHWPINCLETRNDKYGGDGLLFFLVSRALYTALQYCVPCTICNLSIVKANKHIEPAFTLISADSIGTAQNFLFVVPGVRWSPECSEPLRKISSRPVRLHVLFSQCCYFSQPPQRLLQPSSAFCPPPFGLWPQRVRSKQGADVPEHCASHLVVAFHVLFTHWHRTNCCYVIRFVIAMCFLCLFPHLCRLGVAGRFLRPLWSSSPAASQLIRSICIYLSPACPVILALKCWVVIGYRLVLNERSEHWDSPFLWWPFVFASSLSCHAQPRFLDPACSRLGYIRKFRLYFE